MRIGLDLDNTIACYDALFAELAASRFSLPDGARDKTSIRNSLREAGREAEWTALQGEVYGPMMHLARPFDGLIEFLRQAVSRDVKLCIISHRTEKPYAGPPHDLRQAALDWLKHNSITGPSGFLREAVVYLEPTREAKMARVAEFACDVFVDDLPEFLLDPSFPPSVQPIWFNPNRHPAPDSGLESIDTWFDLPARLNW